MPAPAIDGTRYDKVISVRLTLEVHKRLCAKARARKKHQSVYIRELCEADVLRKH